jgi:DNA ligase-1
MPEIEDGQTAQVQGSGSAVYTLKNSGGVYSCTCPAWMHQSIGIERRTCKHLRAYRGDDAEKARLGDAALTGKPPRPPREPGAEPADADDDDEGPPLLLAHPWDAQLDLTGWWLSEKLDGVRAYWDGKQFLSRLGNKFHPPPWFIERLPADTPLDGELWGGRKLFQRTVGIVKRQDQSPLWKGLVYVVFDAPSHGGVFEERIERCRSVLDGRTEFARVHEQVVCRGIDHLREELARVEAMGGEGLMVRKPRSKYEAGRSSTLLKVKSFHDAEARVVGHVAGAGRHKGRLGALLVELENGTRFNVGTGFSDAERENPPAVGSIITFRYQELSDGGVPRFPSYVGERIDAKLAMPKPRPIPAPQAPHASAPSGRRRFELEDGDRRLFWEIERDGAKHRVRFGTFEVKVKRFESEQEAAAEIEARIAEKLGKGFREV